MTYSYDTLGQITGLTVTPPGGTTQAVVSNATYLPFGPIQTYTLGNGQTISRTYDANYRITDIVSPALELHFIRDAMGNITRVSEAGTGSESYRYDPLYRLASVDDPAGQAIEAYTYNKTGDRLSKTGNGLATGNYGYQPGTHWLTSIGTASRTYDANGNTTGNAFAGDAWGYGYNGRNRMTVVQRNGQTVGSYVYNSLEQRTSKTAEGTTTRFAYDEGSQLLSEATGSTARDYLWLGGIPVGVLDNGGAASLNYVHADALGSPRVVTTNAGAMAWHWSYTSNPFGAARPISTTGYVLNLRFPGQYSDEKTETTYNIHRQYDSLSGRYLSADPLGLIAGGSAYNYANAMPLNTTDQFGLCADNCISVVPEKPNSNNINDDVYVMENLKRLTYVSGGIGAGFELRTFYELVRNKGAWDFKQQGRQYADYGNFHYGVAGAAGGIPEEMLLRAAGWAQTRSGNYDPSNSSPLGNPPYGDDPADQTQIKNGIWWYQNCR